MSQPSLVGAATLLVALAGALHAAPPKPSALPKASLRPVAPEPVRPGPAPRPSPGPVTGSPFFRPLPPHDPLHHHHHHVHGPAVYVYLPYWTYYYSWGGPYYRPYFVDPYAYWFGPNPTDSFLLMQPGYRGGYPSYYPMWRAYPYPYWYGMVPLPPSPGAPAAPMPEPLKLPEKPGMPE